MRALLLLLLCVPLAANADTINGCVNQKNGKFDGV